MVRCAFFRAPSKSGGRAAFLTYTLCTKIQLRPPDFDGNKVRLCLEFTIAYYAESHSYDAVPYSTESDK